MSTPFADSRVQAPDVQRVDHNSGAYGAIQVIGEGRLFLHDEHSRRQKDDRALAGQRRHPSHDIVDALQRELQSSLARLHHLTDRCCGSLPCERLL